MSRCKDEDPKQGRWVSCNCHPETCCHEGREIYHPYIEFKIDEKQRDKLELNKQWIPAKQTLKVLKEFGLKGDLDFDGRVRIQSNIDKIKIDSFERYRKTEFETKYFYTIKQIIEVVLEHQSKIRKKAYRDFKNML